MEHESLLYCLVFVFAIILFLLIRYIILWYFKINVFIFELQRNNELLLDILEELKKDKENNQ